MAGRQPMTDRLRNAVCSLERLLADRESAYERIEKDFPDQYLKIEAANERRNRIALVKKTFDKDWMRYVKRFASGNQESLKWGRESSIRH